MGGSKVKGLLLKWHNIFLSTTSLRKSNCIIFKATSEIGSQSSHISRKKQIDRFVLTLLKICTLEFVPILTFLFQISYLKSIFPDSSKSGRVQSVPKRDLKPSNRVISMLPIITKVIELIINLNFLKQFELIKIYMISFPLSPTARTNP